MRNAVRTALVCAIAITIGIAGTAVGASLITGKQIRNGSIGLKDLSRPAKRSLKGQAGPQGPAGPAGPTGPTGATGGFSSTTTVDGAEVAMAGGGGSGTVQSAVATCPAGTVVTGGGWRTGPFVFIAFATASANSYAVIGVNDGTLATTITAKAICAQGSGATAVAAQRRHGAVNLSRIVARLREQVAAQG